MNEQEAQNRGLICINDVWIHETASIDAPCDIGSGTLIWHYTHIRENVKIGRGCSIGSNVYIAPDVIIGNGVKIGNFTHIPSGVVIKDRVSAQEGVVISKCGGKPTIIEDEVLIEAGARLLGGLRIGAGAKIEEGAIVTRNVSKKGHILGFPSRCVCKQPDCLECSSRRKMAEEKHKKYLMKGAYGNE